MSNLWCLESLPGEALPRPPIAQVIRVSFIVFLGVLWSFAAQACGGSAVVDSESHATVGEMPSAHVLSVARPYYSQNTAIVFDATVHAGEADVSMTLQPLAAADRTTPVGASASGGPFPLSALGLFVAHFEFSVAVEAIGPLVFEVAPETPLELSLTLNAEQPTCGSAEGSLTYRTQLGGSAWREKLTDSTFAMVPGGDVSAHIDPIIDCSGTHAPPL